MTLDNMIGITKGSWTVDSVFCKSQLINCNRVKECNGVCPFEDALKHAEQTDKQTVDCSTERCYTTEGGGGKTYHPKYGRLIDADALKSNLFLSNGDGYVVSLDAINNAPTVDVIGQCEGCIYERPHGEWLFNAYEKQTKSWNICSVCGHDQVHETNFCPNCGADMRGDDNG